MQSMGIMYLAFVGNRFMKFNYFSFIYLDTPIYAHLTKPKVVRIVACPLPGAPSYGGVRTRVEGSQNARGPRIDDAHSNKITNKQC